jgi:hypothetical protein
MKVPTAHVEFFKKAESIYEEVHGFPLVAKDWVLIIKTDVDKRGAWYSDAHGFWISGYTECYGKKIVIGNKQNLCDSAYFHELFHLFEGCPDGDHVLWAEKGFYSKIVMMEKECNAAYIK